MRKIEIKITRVDPTEGLIHGELSLFHSYNCIDPECTKNRAACMECLGKCEVILTSRNTESTSFRPVQGQDHIVEMTTEEIETAATMIRCFRDGAFRTFGENMLYHWTT